MDRTLTVEVATRPSLKRHSVRLELQVCNAPAQRELPGAGQPGLEVDMVNSTPCHYCGVPVAQSLLGRPAKYCSRSHRQRAYEDRQKFYTRGTLLAMADTLGWECYICGGELTHETIQFDHVIPLSLGGPDEPENIRPVCLVCNATKGAKLMFVPTDSA